MSDQHRPTHRPGYKVSYDTDFSPHIPNGTLALFNKAFKKWEERRGIVRKPAPFRGRALSGLKAKQNKNKA
ncbi:MAG: hypothetical protein FJZ59_07585 [Chlamydiae bacterium]|nr:hypothetical protein [Chlamydiota bacterium]